MNMVFELNLKRWGFLMAKQGEDVVNVDTVSKTHTYTQGVSKHVAGE